MNCDVVIIGGGIGGVSVGACLARDCRVVLIEAEPELARHATGRSAAMYLPAYGGPAVRWLTEASRTGYEDLALLRGHSLLTPRRMLWLATDESSTAALVALEAETRLLERTDVASAVEMCPPLVAGRIRVACVDAGAMEIDVAGLHETYVARLRRSGGTILRGAPLVSATRRSAGWSVRAGTHVLSAEWLVDAAGAWVDQVAALAGARPVGLVPHRRTAFISPVPVRFSAQSRSWPLVADAAERWYFKPDGGALLCSPADETPCEPCDARPDELAIARALEDINAITSLELRRVSHAWAGLRSFVPDHAPVVGCDEAVSGFLFFGAQGGYGIQMAPALAELGASVVLRGCAPASWRGFDVAAVSPRGFPGATKAPSGPGAA